MTSIEELLTYCPHPLAIGSKLWDGYVNRWGIVWKVRKSWSLDDYRYTVRWCDGTANAMCFHDAICSHIEIGMMKIL